MVRAICEMTVSISEGTARIWADRKETPRNRVAKMLDIHIKVMPAFLARGSLKAVMPLEIASMPVRAEVPLENACSSSHGVTATRAPSSENKGGLTTVPSEPVAYRKMPT